MSIIIGCVCARFYMLRVTSADVSTRVIIKNVVAFLHLMVVWLLLMLLLLLRFRSSSGHHLWSIDIASEAKLKPKLLLVLVLWPGVVRLLSASQSVDWCSDKTVNRINLQRE